MSFSAYVLAGGASTRMGTDKALLMLRGSTLIDHALQLLRSLGLTPGIISSRNDLASYAPVVPDLRANCGPLCGIEAGLQASTSEAAVFLPVDVPLLPRILLSTMMSRHSLTGALVTLPRFLGQPQPLCAIYSRSLLPAISTALDHGDYKVTRVMTNAALAIHGPPAIDIFDIEAIQAADRESRNWPTSRHSMFLNCNTPADLDEADSRLGRATGTVESGLSFA